MCEILKNHEESILSFMSGLRRAKVCVREGVYGWREIFKCSCQAEREERLGELHARVQEEMGGEKRSSSFKEGKAPSLKRTDPRLSLITQ